MSLAGELASARNYRPNRPKCTVCAYVQTLTDADRQALDEALASDMMTAAIHSALIKVGQNFAIGTVQRHRNGRCRGTA